MLSTDEAIITIAAVIGGTMLTRFLPFVIFYRNRTTPLSIKYLGNVLPTAIIALLVVYSLKDTVILSGNHGFPEVISTTVTILLHVWKRNMLLSIAAGTITHMLLLQYIFSS
ncbi:branched-chain amino acid transporter permease [Pectinatus haikarae]|uniref:Branched-subunit amino acid transport protein AzlD n=1 Tax=Pectinatus haikarae TaxID=349096 RepID=A0ABT9YAV2_9FIRM|nr:AzlD domain-containing protein [Pectinatus haikarae]MDQ0204964.1 branched-subunit amino acid transport protein AzlD [Pectinatus haikarae]